MSNRKRQEPAEPPLLPPPYTADVLSFFDDSGKWLQRTHGGPLLRLSASARRRLEGLHHNMHAPEPEAAQYSVMDLLEWIAVRGEELRSRGRPVYDLPADARDVLLAFLWGEPTDRDDLRRAAEAARDLESRLYWRMTRMPLVYPNGDPFARGIFERDDDG
jgi:hypothetical protein